MRILLLLLRVLKIMQNFQVLLSQKNAPTVRNCTEQPRKLRRKKRKVATDFNNSQYQSIKKTYKCSNFWKDPFLPHPSGNFPPSEFSPKFKNVNAGKAGD